MKPISSIQSALHAGLLVLAPLAPALASCVSTTETTVEEPASAPETTFDSSGERVPSARTLQTMAHILANRGNDPQCEVVLLKLVDFHPEFAPAYNELAELYMRQGRSEEAASTLQAGVAAVPGDSVLWNNSGMVHLLRGEFQAARESFTRACAVAPDDARPRANLAVALAMSGRLEEAEAVYLQATTRSRAYHDLAVLCETRGDMEDARRYHDLSDGRVVQ